MIFPNVGVVNGEMTKSDHRPLVIDTEFYKETNRPLRPVKRFEGRWLKEETVEEVVRTAWQRASLLGLGPFKQKVDSVHEELHKWDRETLKRAQKRMAKLKKELEELRRGLATDVALDRQKEILLVIENLLEQEEIAWVQRGRAN